MSPTNLQLHPALLLIALLALSPLAAAETEAGKISTSGASPLLNDPRAGEPGTIPAAPAEEAVVSASESQPGPAPLGFVGPADAPQGAAGTDDPNLYRGLWEIQPDNSVKTPHASGMPSQETER